MAELRLAKDISRHVRLGHPWIYRDALAPGKAARGAVVDVVARGGAHVARGFFDPDGPLAVRVLALAPVALDEAWLHGRVARAAAIRTAARIDSDGVRLLHGEGDFVPGLVLDRYAGVGAVRFDGAAAEAFWRPRLPAIAAAAGEAGYPLGRVWSRRGEALAGDAPEPVVMREGEARFEVDVVHGQKTGFFLDQRGNRARVGELAAGARVLNVFAYTGGFSVAAGLGGARAVTTVDVAAPAIAAARRNLERNGLPAGELVAADAFAFLEEARAAGRTWDLVICDPPSFAPRADAVARALRAYRTLNRAAAAVVAASGLLVTASCSSHVTAPDFRAAVAAGLTDARRDARLLDARGAGPDHPVLPAFPEGEYLKVLYVAVS
ncbi:MAG TPA: class I SAM-dependent rRNA methyltransferase [Haliangiales bacterium]|nr:class I SAM-dependent rRNA methyltransferase [Haliangiales bacterium]